MPLKELENKHIFPTDLDPFFYLASIDFICLPSVLHAAEINTSQVVRLGAIPTFSGPDPVTSLGVGST